MKQQVFKSIIFFILLGLVPLCANASVGLGGDLFFSSILNSDFLETLSNFISFSSSFWLGLGVFFLFLEFKTSGFGIFGLIGSVILLFVFVSLDLAGFAGYEALAMFAAGMVFVLLELFLFTGTLVCGLLGIILILASLILSGLSIPEGEWLPETTSLALSVWKCIFAVIFAFALLLVFGRFFKSTRIWNKFVLEGGLGMGKNSDELKKAEDSLLGVSGLAFTDMAPNGKVDINGKIYDAANVDSSFIKKGTEIEVVGHNSFELKIKSKK